MEELIAAVISFVGLIGIIALLKTVPRTGGTNPIFHAGFVVFCIAVLCVPEPIHDIIFTPESVLVVGTIIPLYYSVLAVVSIDTDNLGESIGDSDDTTWLQFWVASGAFTYCTEWMDVIAEKFPQIAEQWYQLELFTLLWLLLPVTDGSTLLFHKFIGPICGALATSIKEKVEGQISLIFFVINSSYLWFLWFIFLTLDEEERRTIVIAVGTIYPIAASTVSCTTKSDKRDDSFWLCYWICFSILFLMMDYLEHFVGKIRGFYSLCLCATVYLFLPIFKGADVVFRNVIVPLTGQYENMYLKDIHLMKIEMLRKIPKSSKESVLAKAAAIFKDSKSKAE